MDKIIIFDFGSQTTQLIGRRVREAGVYSEIVPHDTPVTAELLDGAKGIILSGSPRSVYEQDAPKVDPAVYRAGLPIMGICYGLHRMTVDHGGEVMHRDTREFGRSRVLFRDGVPLFEGIPEGFVSWMSHGDSVTRMAPGFVLAAESEHGHPAAIADPGRSVYGLQFHPEVTHSEHGSAILENFAVRICGARREWDVDAFLHEAEASVREKVGDGKVLLLISGGVDSTVVAGLLLKSLPPERVHLMYIDTGLMRKDESEEVAANLRTLGARHLHLIDARERFLSALRGVSDPEEKRRIIGDMFITVQEAELRALDIGDAFLAQGTLYTDLVESGRGVGTGAQVIKSHHNVRSPLVEEKRRLGLIVEPLEKLYKDEVRRLGLRIGISPEIVRRHPFPGPGLAVRILGDITQEKCDILREADALYIDELKKRGLYDSIWQAFCVLLPIRSVGVTGDARGYGYVLSLRAVVSHDGMTADVFPFPTEDLLEISSRITNAVPQIGRVVYDVSSKPPATIEWE